MNASDLTLVVKRHDPAETEIHLHAPEPVSARLLGPRCRFASTVEVAYWFRPAPGMPGTLRAIVPEPSFWDPEAPFLYDAIAHTAAGSEIRRTLGLRSIQLGADGFRIERRPLRLNAVARDRLDDAAALRQAGVNAIVCSVTPETTSIWADADAWGFLVLGEISAESLPLLPQLEAHASCLGWIVDPFLAPPTGFVGVRTKPGMEPAAWARFTLGEAPSGDLPWIAIGDDASSPGSIGVVR
ncbi:MAG TPA: hypothetical protein VHR72_09710 [Gemmataceae bacterium]|jgi:hypothetical protein|nr:hypothetical protein [Gemmataceae bacterium]